MEVPQWRLLIRGGFVDSLGRFGISYSFALVYSVREQIQKQSYNL